MSGPIQNSASTLILIPTAAEARLVESERLAASPASPFALCGFGPVAAAAACARELARVKPRRVLLIGIAGSFDIGRYPIGSALHFGHVSLDGIGAGTGERLSSPRDLGLPQWPGHGQSPDIFDTLPLAGPDTKPGPNLLTVCACSGSTAQAKRRRGHFATPVAEDMEGFGVAMAAHQFDLPVGIVRGISNEVGDRDHLGWGIEEAMQAAWTTALVMLNTEAWSEAP